MGYEALKPIISILKYVLILYKTFWFDMPLVMIWNSYDTFQVKHHFIEHEAELERARTACLELLSLK